MKRSIRNILLSLVGFSAAPMLTACYGTPYDELEPFDSVEGFVVTTDMKPIQNIRVGVEGRNVLTDEQGHFFIESPYNFYGDVLLTATDIDGEANGGDFGTESVTVTAENHSVVSVVMEKK